MDIEMDTEYKLTQEIDYYWIRGKLKKTPDKQNDLECLALKF